MTEDEKRAQTITALREFADLLEAHPQLPCPYFGGAFASIGYRLPHADAVNDLFDLAEILGVDVLAGPDGKHEAKLMVGGQLEYLLYVHPEKEHAAAPKIAVRPPRTAAAADPAGSELPA